MADQGSGRPPAGPSQETVTRAQVRREADERLAASLRVGDDESFGRLYDAWVDPVHDHLVNAGIEGADVEPALVSVFSGAWEGVRGGGSEPFGVVVMRLAEAATRGRIAPGRAAPVEVSPAPEDRLTKATSLDSAAGDPQITALLWQSAAALGPRGRETLDLHFRHGLDAEEIAAITGRSAPEVTQTLTKLPLAFDQVVRARVLWRGGRPDDQALAEALGGRTEVFDADTVRTVVRHLRADAKARARSMVPLGPTAIFAAVGVSPAGKAVKRSTAVALVAAGVPLGRSEFAPDAAWATDRDDDEATAEVPSVVAASAVDATDDEAPPAEVREPEVDAETEPDGAAAADGGADAEDEAQDEDDGEGRSGALVAGAAAGAAVAGGAAAAAAGEPGEGVDGDDLSADDDRADDVSDVATDVTATGASAADGVPAEDSEADGGPVDDSSIDDSPTSAGADGASDVAGDDTDEVPVAAAAAGGAGVGAAASSRVGGDEAPEPISTLSGRPASETHYEPTPERNRTGLFIGAGAAAAVVVLVAALVIFSGGDDDADVATAGDVRAADVTTTTTAPPVTRPPRTTTTTEPVVGEIEEEIEELIEEIDQVLEVTTTTARPGGPGGGGDGGGGGAPGPAPGPAPAPTTAPPPITAPPITAPLSWSSGMSLLPDSSISSGGSAPTLSWAVRANRNVVSVQLFGPGTPNGGVPIDGSIPRICPVPAAGTQCNAGPGQYQYRLRAQFATGEVLEDVRTLTITSGPG